MSRKSRRQRKGQLKAARQRKQPPAPKTGPQQQEPAAQERDAATEDLPGARRTGRRAEREGVRLQRAEEDQRKRWLRIGGGVEEYFSNDMFVAIHPENDTVILYEQVPPVGGPHNTIWQNCGYYDDYIYNWHGVHSLEHGAVWLTFDPELSEADRSVLEDKVGQGSVLVSPYPGLDAPVVGLMSRTPGNSSAEAGFLRDMIPHHDQAVELGLIIRDRTDDEQRFFLATDIVLTQQDQIGMMGGWLSLWELSPNQQGPMMEWMDMPIESGLMPGTATPEQIEEMRTLPIDEAEILFLEALPRHHQGGVHMAEAYLERGDQAQVSAFSENMIMVQEREIQIMNTMLEQRGDDPITDDLDMGHNH